MLHHVLRRAWDDRAVGFYGLGVGGSVRDVSTAGSCSLPWSRGRIQEWLSYYIISVPSNNVLSYGDSGPLTAVSGVNVSVSVKI